MNANAIFPKRFEGAYLKLMALYGADRILLADVELEENEEWYLVVFHEVQGLHFGYGFQIGQHIEIYESDESLTLRSEAEEFEIRCRRVEVLAEPEGEEYFDRIEAAQEHYRGSFKRVSLRSLIN